MTQASPIAVQDVLREEHRSIISLINHPDCIGVSERGNELRRQLMTTIVKHFVAEERYLYPVVRRQVINGDDFVERAVATNREGEMLIARLGDPTLTAMGLAALCKEVRGAFALHVGKQDPIIAVLAARSDPEALVDLGQLIREATHTVTPLV